MCYFLRIRQSGCWSVHSQAELLSSIFWRAKKIHSVTKLWFMIPQSNFTSFVIQALSSLLGSFSCKTTNRNDWNPLLNYLYCSEFEKIYNRVWISLVCRWLLCSWKAFWTSVHCYFVPLVLAKFPLRKDLLDK